MTNIDFTDLLEKTKTSFSNTISRIINVADCDDNGNPCYLKKTRLAKRSGIARSSIAKYFSDDETLNPDLKTLCRLSSALNIPPAFLLMRPCDWRAIAEFSLSADKLLANEDTHLLINEILKAKTSNERAKKCLALAHCLSVDNDNTTRCLTAEKEYKTDIKSAAAVFSASALPPLSEMSDDYLAQLFLLSIVISST